MKSLRAVVETHKHEIGVLKVKLLETEMALQESQSSFSRENERIVELARQRSESDRRISELEAERGSHSLELASVQHKLSGLQAEQEECHVRIARQKQKCADRKARFRDELDECRNLIADLNTQLQNANAIREEQRLRTMGWIEELNFVLPLIEAELGERGHMIRFFDSDASEDPPRTPLSDLEYQSDGSGTAPSQPIRTSPKGKARTGLLPKH
jgi:chromosome segregation ATPase